MIREIFERLAQEHEWDSPEEVIASAQFQTTWSFIELTCKEYARLMCDKQKEICVKNIKFVYGEMDVEETTHKEIVDIDYEKFFNSPYPKELL